jgi:YggT family protein
VLFGIVSLIVNSVAWILGGAFLLRFWMQAVRVRPPMALAQFVFKLTDWLVRPLRKVLPGVGGYDWASMTGAVLMAVVATLIVVAVGSMLSAQALILFSLLRLVEWIFYDFMGMIFIGAVFSWVNPHAPMAPFVGALSDPIIRPIRRVVPLIGNVDLSPMVALLLLQIGLQIVRYLIASLV